MSRWQEGGTIWNIIETIAITLDTAIWDCIIKIDADMHRAWLDFQMPPIMFMHFLNHVVNKYHGLFFCGIDIPDWIVRFLDLWTRVIFRSTFLY